MTPSLHLLYGHPPRELADIPPDAVQCSPLIPGSAELEGCADAASATLYAPPGTLERRYSIALALRALAPGAPLTALAPKDKGGSRLAAELEAFGCEVADTSRAHHRIVTTTRPASLVGIERALAEGGLRQYPAHGLWAQPGIFSWDRIDVGSALLLKHLAPLSGCGADLGAGIGILARAALSSPDVRELTLIDIDLRAITAAGKNIRDTRAQFLWADLRNAPLPSDLDFIVMNPPFHDTGIEDKSLGQLFITRAASMLKPGGKLWLTANKHLPYEAHLAKLFAHVTLVDDADGFKIFMGEK